MNSLHKYHLEYFIKLKVFEIFMGGRLVHRLNAFCSIEMFLAQILAKIKISGNFFI